MPLKLATKGLHGRMSKTATVHTNAPSPQAAVTLTLQADVWEPVAFEPRALNFGRLTSETAGSEGLVQRLTITNNMDTVAAMTGIRSTNPLFQPDVQTLEPGKKFELTVRVVGTLKGGQNSGTIELATGVQETPNLSIPISAYVAPDVEVMPSTILLPANRTTNTTRQLTVRNNTKTPLKISDLVVSNPALAVKLQETQPGSLYTVTLEVPLGSQIAANGDQISFKTDSSSYPVFVVPVTEMRAPAAVPNRSSPGPGTNNRPGSGEKGQQP